MIQNNVGTVDDIVNEFADKPGRELPKQTVIPQPIKAKTVEKPVEKPKKDAEWHYRMMDALKWTTMFGGLAAVLIYWWVSGQMATSAVVPSLGVCGWFFGYGVGKNVGDR